MNPSFYLFEKKVHESIHSGSVTGYWVQSTVNGDVDHCNQLMSNHLSNAVFMRFVSRWRREEFYSCYLHFVNKRTLLIATVFRQYKDSLGRIYVSEHLTSQVNLVYKGVKKLKKSGLVKKVSTRKGCVCIVSLDGKEKFVENVDELRRMTRHS
jgi:hypothetical protein